MHGFISRIGRLKGLLKPVQVRIARESCALCRFPFQLRLSASEMAVRCPRCGASAVTQSLVDVLGRSCADLSVLDAYEMSAAGPLVPYLKSRCRSLRTSEYFDDIRPGDSRNGIVCQDVQRLTFPANSFDLCTSTEVFEHVEDDRAGFREIFRVLRPGGTFVFTVPIDPDAATVERTELRDNVRVRVLPVEYHADRYRGANILCHRNYGRDIVARLREAGFATAGITKPERSLFGFARPVVFAGKAIDQSASIRDHGMPRHA
jgi:SAM-dependent methyltransferase